MQPRSGEPIRLVHEYLDADYRATVDARHIVLRIGQPAPAFLADADLVFITAWDPGSVPRDEAENRAALAALRAALAPHAAIHDAVGADAGVIWHEPSLLAIGLPLELADREARRHEQNAIVTVRAGEPARLRMYRPEWRTAVEAANLDMRFVDWVASPAPA